MFVCRGQGADAGVTEVGIVVGDTADEIKEAVGDGSAFGIDVTYMRREAPLGLAHAVMISQEFLGDDDFVGYPGDNFIVGGITEPVRNFHEHRPAAHVLLTRVADPSAFGIAERAPLLRLSGAWGRVGRHFRDFSRTVTCVTKSSLKSRATARRRTLCPAAVTVHFSGVRKSPVSAACSALRMQVRAHHPMALRT
ncbi:hypothetical protein JW592_20405 [Streptomyces sp. DW4-2]|uniref:Glucose-1-phosphate thymidylyltransferase n=1 Tax=Streptomyces spirodelae TaxID=2812904 RepID=A0ABS3WY75_9ACTN|nr:hypothetical protein [Streptomyces spirodelae]